MDRSFIYQPLYINYIHSHFLYTKVYWKLFFSYFIMVYHTNCWWIKIIGIWNLHFFSNISGYFCNTNLSAILSFLIVALIHHFIGHCIIQPSCKERRKKKSSLCGLSIFKWDWRLENLNITCTSLKLVFLCRLYNTMTGYLI